MKSTLVKGRVFHQRFFPVSHRFQYPVYFYCLDLSELETLDRTLPGFAYNRMGITAIHDRDYLDDRKGSIRDKLFRFLEQVHCRAGIERILMITSARLFFPVFNPVTFYYCLTARETLGCVVAEVNNTFGERHLYILAPDMQTDDSHRCFTAKKVFHVSPFNAIEGVYEFYFGPLDQGIDIRITMRVGGEKKFIAGLWGEHLPLTGKNRILTWLRHPVLPHMTRTRILKEAFILYFKKKLPYVPKPIDTNPMTIGKQPSNLLQKMCMKLFLRALNRIENEYLAVTLPDGRCLTFGTPLSKAKADLVILAYDLFPKVILSGDIGLGEAYMQGLFQTRDLAALLRLFIRAFVAGKRPKRLLAFSSGVLARLIRFGENNTLPGSRKNIQYHYDLSNAFFRLFLDTSMTYSCALFRSDADTLEKAQEQKLRQIIDKARITPDDHVLEIGSGWGSFAVAAVRQTGCRVTTLTLSRRQHAHVSERIRTLGLENNITVLLKDYRTLTGSFDKIVSIEMLEAVGHRHLGTFFKCCNDLLKPGGRVVLQVITLPDQEYATYRLKLDWIQKHIFPGGHLPSLAAMCAAMTRKTPLIIEHLENIGPHYATTLNHWHERFMGHLEQIRNLGFDPVFIRKWEYYLTSCEAIFRERGLENLQLVLARPYEF